MSCFPSSEFAALAARALSLRPPPPHEWHAILRDEAALLLDGLLTKVACQHGAIDLAIGHGLHDLAQGDRLAQLGFSCLGDYARERLGMGFSTARALQRLARELAARPALHAAVRSGHLSHRKALTVLPVAQGREELAWIARARAMTVRQLEVAVRDARTGSEARLDSDGAQGPWSQVELSLTAAQRQTVEQAFSLARKLVGHTAPGWVLVEALCDEFLGAHPPAEDPRHRAKLFRCALDAWRAAAQEGLEHERDCWSALERIEPVAAPDLDLPIGAHDVDERLRELVRLRHGWDGLVGHLAMLLRMLGLWRDLGFATFGHYCSERLHMSGRTVEQRAALERRLYELPSLRAALQEGLSYDKARIIARHATERTVDELLRRARDLTCIGLARELEQRAEAQMCSSGWYPVVVPSSTPQVLEAACTAVLHLAGRWLHAGDCFERIAQHFIDTWEPVLRRPSTLRARVRARDRHLCQVPGCSRPGGHVHHIQEQQHGGGDDPENLVTVCATHHLRCLHRGYVRVAGRAPHRLRWELGVRHSRTAAGGRSGERRHR
jgi:hypothetical protein